MQGPAVPHLTPMQALRRLGTITGLPMNGATKHDDALVQKIVASVKRMQVEREALKWRCRDLGHQVTSDIDSAACLPKLPQIALGSCELSRFSSYVQQSQKCALQIALCGWPRDCFAAATHPLPLHSYSTLPERR